MRMWGVKPNQLCRKHLLGEHVEMHMFAGTVKAKKSITGYIRKGLVNPRLIKTRHDELAKELESRGYNHQSPLEFNCLNLPEHFLSIKSNIRELKSRCPICFNRKEKVEEFL